VIAVAILAFASSLQSAPLSRSAPLMQQMIANAAKRIVPVVVPAVLPDTDPPKTVTRKPIGQEVLKLDSVRVSASRTANAAPRYPDRLRAANVERDVLAQFVVNTDGTVDMSTFKVLKSTHDLFSESVKSALPNMKFNAAQVGGLPVKQLVQMPFNFSLSKGT